MAEVVWLERVRSSKGSCCRKSKSSTKAVLSLGHKKAKNSPSIRLAVPVDATPGKEWERIDVGIEREEEGGFVLHLKPGDRFSFKCRQGKHQRRTNLCAKQLDLLFDFFKTDPNACLYKEFVVEEGVFKIRVRD